MNREKFESTKTTLIDLLLEHGDEDTVAALRNLEWLVKVQKWRQQVETAVRWSPYGNSGYCDDCGAESEQAHKRACNEAILLREILGPVEVERQANAAHEEALREKTERQKPPAPPSPPIEVLVDPNVPRDTAYLFSPSTFTALFQRPARDLVAHDNPAVRLLRDAPSLSVPWERDITGTGWHRTIERNGEFVYQSLSAVEMDRVSLATDLLDRGAIDRAQAQVIAMHRCLRCIDHREVCGCPQT